MPRYAFDVPVRQVQYQCDQCQSMPNQGCALEFVRTKIIDSNNIKYIHVCPNCDKEFTLDYEYPYIQIGLPDKGTITFKFEKK